VNHTFPPLDVQYVMELLVIRKAATWILAAVLVLPALPAAEATEARDILGVAHAGGKYNFTSEDFLNEGADRILELGSRVLKIFLVPSNIQNTYPFNSDWSPAATDVVELAQRPYVQEVFAKPFSTFMLVVTPVTVAPQFLDGLTRDEAAAEREQMYRLAKYLLTTYANTGKTFILQNWEGDHLFRQGLATGEEPDAVRIQGMIDWWNARQDGVRQARKEVGEHGVTVLHAAEVNALQRAMDGKISATNDVVPFTRCDLYSYSSWDLGFTPDKLVQALDYLESKAPDNRRFGRRNLYLGEYGLGKDSGVPEGERFERIRQLMEAALGWGVRYAVYWQVYCNEAVHTYTGRPRNRDLRGFWLVRPDGERAPIWDTFDTQLRAAHHRAAFSSFSSQYVSVAKDGDRAVSAERWTRGGFWETFTLKDWNGGALESGDVVTLQAHDGLYLSVEAGIGGRVYATSSSAGRPERLILRKIGGAGPILPGDSVAFQSTRSNRYLGAEVGSHSALHALRTAPGPAETFRYVEPEE
jgi:PAS domain-containing protein